MGPIALQPPTHHRAVPSSRTCRGRKSIPNETGANMNRSLLTFTALFIATLPYAAHAQGTIRGAEEGAAAGDRAAGPLGAIVGGAVGAATGTVGGILGVEERPR